MIENKKIALVGNPNCGKSSIFNQLTGLRQKVGNFPGVTVDKKIGRFTLDNEEQVTLIDLPGTYSLFPNALDERVVVQILANHKHPDYPDLLVYVADVTDLEKQLLLLSQIIDLEIPCVLALNMADLKADYTLEVDINQMESTLGIPVIELSGRTGQGIDNLRSVIQAQLQVLKSPASFSKLSLNGIFQKTQAISGAKNLYEAKLHLHHSDWLTNLSMDQKFELGKLSQAEGFKNLSGQIEETMFRYQTIGALISKSLRKPVANETSSDKADRILTHSVIGPIIFLLLMAFIFQAIFSWAGAPMDLIDGFFGGLSDTIKASFPENWWVDLLTDGVLAGIGATVIFIPQIAILFLFISLLEEIGYMARVVLLFDRLMQKFGLNGRSMVALISANACAIPAIMSTRTIGNWKERLITILITPFMSCSARIPVYIILIGISVPSITYFGVFNAQGLAFGLLYILGLVGALALALLLKYTLKIPEPSYLALSLPDYKLPSWRNVFINVYEKVKTFVLEAGKIILIISMILWALSSYGPGDAMEKAASKAQIVASQQQLSPEEAANLVAAEQLEASYAGTLGKVIEPVIRPLGFDWKIGIGILTSFAAREVFIGTLATIHQLGSEDSETKIIDRLALAVNPRTGEKLFNTATSWSLLIFFVFAMQCMSTLAVVKRETKSWKWPIFQFVLMTAIAYFASFLTYQMLA